MVNFLSHPNRLNDVLRRSIYRPMLEATRGRRDSIRSGALPLGRTWTHHMNFAAWPFTFLNRTVAGTGGLTIERLRGTGEKVVAYSDAPFESEDQARMDGCVRTTLRAPMLRASKSALPEEAVTYYLWTGSATDLCFEVDSVGNRDQKTKMSSTTRCSGSRNCALTNRH